jgi:hypothetical protein
MNVKHPNKSSIYFKARKLFKGEDAKTAKSLVSDLWKLGKAIRAVKKAQEYYRKHPVMLVAVLLSEQELLSQLFANHSMGELTPEQQTAVMQAEEIRQRFTGKKITKERMIIYGEIEDEHRDSRSKGALGNYKEATRIVAKKHAMNPEKLYKSFLKYKNQLYANSPKKRPS